MPAQSIKAAEEERTSFGVFLWVFWRASYQSSRDDGWSNASFSPCLGKLLGRRSLWCRKLILARGCLVRFSLYVLSCLCGIRIHFSPRGWILLRE